MNREVPDMGPGRAYGGGLNMANWLVQGSTLYYGVTCEKKHRYSQMHPFIVGDGWNRVPADDICGVITPNAPSDGSLG